MKLFRNLIAGMSLFFTTLVWAAVNINTADVETLQSLHGIGQSKAVAIVEHRELHGPFQSLEELAEVKGIGAKTVEKNKAEITLK